MSEKAKLHILVVDDDVEMCVVLDHLLKKFDSLSYKIVNNPYDALLDMAQNEYDLLLLDINIPEISGPEILKAMDQFITQDGTIKKSDLYRGKVPVVLMSSSPALLKKEVALTHFHVQQKILKKNLQIYLTQRLANLEGQENENLEAH